MRPSSRPAVKVGKLLKNNLCWFTCAVPFAPRLPRHDLASGKALLGLVGTLTSRYGDSWLETCPHFVAWLGDLSLKAISLSFRGPSLNIAVFKPQLGVTSKRNDTPMS